MHTHDGREADMREPDAARYETESFCLPARLTVPIIPMTSFKRSYQAGNREGCVMIEKTDPRYPRGRSCRTIWQNKAGGGFVTTGRLPNNIDQKHRPLITEPPVLMRARSSTAPHVLYGRHISPQVWHDVNRVVLTKWYEPVKTVPGSRLW